MSVNVFKLGEDFGFELANIDGSNCTATSTGHLYIRENNLNGEIVFEKAMTPVVEANLEISSFWVKVTPEEAIATLPIGKYVAIMDVRDPLVTRDIEDVSIKIVEGGAPNA